MPLQPDRLLARLWRDPAALAKAADGVLTSAEQWALHRPQEQQGWSLGDIARLDELSELIGDQPASAATRAAHRRQAEENAEQLRFAQESLTSLGLEDSISAELLASRYRATAGTSDVAHRAAADRSWVYGHVVIDEAQELSQMALEDGGAPMPDPVDDRGGRRRPDHQLNRRRELVGRLRRPRTAGWRLQQLTVNYRTPATVMQLAARATMVPGTTGESNPEAGDAVPQLRSLRPGSRPVAVRSPSG
jgi:hypothetical protein